MLEVHNTAYWLYAEGYRGCRNNKPIVTLASRHGRGSPGSTCVLSGMWLVPHFRRGWLDKTRIMINPDGGSTEE